MSIYNKIAGDYFLITVDPSTGNVSSDNVTIQTHTVTIDGNLSVIGDTTMINVEETTIKDPYVVLGAENAGEFPEVGIIAQTNTNELAGLRYNSGTFQWEVSTDVDLDGDGVYIPLATSTTAAPGGDTFALQFKAGNTTFGGADYFTVDVGESRVTLDGNQVFVHVDQEPNSVSNATVVYSDAPDLGDSGVYVNNADVTDELVAYRRARKLSLIL